MKRMSCAFAGHRPEKLPWKHDEADERCINLKAALLSQIAELAESGVMHFLSGMARGVDLWAALSVLELRKHNPKMKLHCILPCTTQADEWSDSEREVYQKILQQTDSVVYVNREYHKECMLERNHFMVDHADMLLVVCGNTTVRRGGTAATIHYAQKMGKKIILLNPLSLDITCENMDNPKSI